MSEYKGANVTKYDAGGSGDNYIPDGYIKSVEKIWTDSVTIGTTALTSADSLLIARIPPGKKITSVEVFYPALTAENCMTGSTLTCGTSDDTDKFILAGELGVMTALGVAAESYRYAARMNNPDGHMYLTTGSSDTAISVYIDRIVSQTTSCTIKSIVRYV